MRDILLVIFENRILVATLFLTTVLSACMWLWLRSDAYETSAKVLIKFARDTADPRSALSPDTARVAPMARPDINTEAELIKSYALVDRVVTTLHLDNPPAQVPPHAVFARIKFEMRRAYRAVRDVADDVQIMLAFKERLTPREMAIVEIIQGLKVDSVKDSSIVKVSLSSHFKVGAGVVVNTLLGFYRQQRMAVERAPGEHVFFAQQAEQHKLALQQTEATLERLKTTYGFGSFDDQMDLTLKNLLDVERRAKDTSAEIAALDAKVRLLQTQVADTPPRSLSSEVSERKKQFDFLEQQKATLEVERQQLLTRYTPDHQAIKDLDTRIQEIASLTAQPDQTVAAAKTTSVNPTYQSLQQELLTSEQQRDAARARLRSQQDTVEVYKAKITELQKAEPEYRQLTREVAGRTEIYRLHQNNAEAAKAAEALNAGGISSIEIVDPAVDPILPSGLSKTYIVGGALLVGLILALSCAFIGDGLDHSTRRPEHIEAALRCPVLASVPACRSFGDAATRTAFQIAASRLDSLTGGVSTRSIACVAANEGAGATTVTAGLALALSRDLGRRTLIVSFAGHDDQLRELLGYEASEAPRASELGEPAWETGVVDVNPTCSVLAARIPPQRSTEQKIAALIANCADQFARFEYVLIDVGGAAMVHERAGLCRGSQGVVVVAEAGRTREEVLQRMRDEYQDAGVLVVGAILNKRRFPIPGVLYRLVA